MDKYTQLKTFPEVLGQRVWRSEVNAGPSRILSAEDWDLGPKCSLADGIHIATVSENSPAELFDAAHLLNVVSKYERSTVVNGFVPISYYDSALAVVDSRVVGGLIAHRCRTVAWRKILSVESEPNLVEGQDRPVVMYLWVHPAHRRKGLGRQLLEASAAHFGRSTAELGFWLPISTAAVGLLRSMDIEEVLGSDGAWHFA